MRVIQEIMSYCSVEQEEATAIYERMVRDKVNFMGSRDELRDAIVAADAALILEKHGMAR